MGGIKLNLGMAQEKAISELAEQLTLRKFKNGWMVYAKVDDPQDLAIAYLEFKNGKLTLVRKFWGPADQQKGVEFARTLYAVVSELTKDGQKCIVSNGQLSDVGEKHSYVNVAIFIDCGTRHARVDVTTLSQSESGESLVAAHINEVLGEQ